jgi:ATP phosphoribosyltransferase
MKPLTLALPKGRLQDQMLALLEGAGIDLSFSNRKLHARDDNDRISAFLVRNSDLPTYVSHGIAGLGVCGEDVLIETDAKLLRLQKLPFGSTNMCLAGLPETRSLDEAIAQGGHLDIATKFPKFTQAYFHSQNVPVEMVKLNGSVELAPLLGLAPYIVDLVETGSTLRANGLVVFTELRRIEVYLVANPAYYKIHFRRVNEFIHACNGACNGACNAVT